MRIRAERDDLADVFARANRAVGTRTALPVLQGLLCEVSGNTLRVTGTDLDVTVKTSAEVDVIEEGRAVIPGRLLAEAVRKMPPGDVTIGVTETEIEIQGNGPRFNLRPLNADDFPTQEDLITDGHLDIMAKILIATSLMVAYGYVMEVFFAWYSGSPFEIFMMNNRFLGPYAPFYWLMILCNIGFAQLLWSKAIRGNPLILFLISIIVNVGMWTERFIIVVTSIHRDFLPSSWGMFSPTGWDWVTLFGSIGLFAMLLFLFVRFLPVISITEVQEMHAEEGSDQ